MPNISSLNNNGAITATSANVKYRQNQSVPLSHNDVDSNFENLRLKLNTVITDTNALTNGDYNLSGPQGTQGLTGSQGAQGIQGLQGRQGTTGNQGIQGRQGITGSQGTQGRQGIIGSQGTTGGQGTQGRQGTTGTGTQGTQGRQGLQGTSGAGASGDISATSITYDNHGPSYQVTYTTAERNAVVPNDGETTVLENSYDGGTGQWAYGNSYGEYVTDMVLNINPDGNGAKQSCILYRAPSSTSSDSEMYLEGAVQCQSMHTPGSYGTYAPRAAFTFANFQYSDGTIDGGDFANASCLVSGGHVYGISNFDMPARVDSDGAMELGRAAHRWKEFFCKSATINTSDERLKQDIEELTEAEKRVAVAAKGLLRKYRWKEAVTKKGDNARTHFGVIAQDLKSAFEAEGLDGFKYSVLCWDEWWEHPTKIDDKRDEETEGYIRKEMYSVRYEELFAFIISAL